MVLVGHSLNVFLPAYFMVPLADGRLQAREGLFYAQNLGVLLFFYISGFLITSSALRKVRLGKGLVDFGADRFARIFTPLVPLLLIVFVIDNLVFGNGAVSRYADVSSGLRDLVLNATMLAGNPALSMAASRLSLEWLSAPSFGSADQLWTVIVEWWIYIVFGFAFFALRVRQRISGVGWILSMPLLALGGAMLAGTGLNSPGLLVAWMAGMIACFTSNRVATASRKLLLPIALLALTGAIGRLVTTSYDLYDPIASALIAVAFFACLFSIDTFAALFRIRIVPPVVQLISNFSYSLYLVHFSILIWAAHLLPEFVGSPVSVIAMFFACNCVAWLFYELFERHYPWVRKRIQFALDRWQHPAGLWWERRQ